MYMHMHMHMHIWKPHQHALHTNCFLASHTPQSVTTEKMGVATVHIMIKLNIHILP